MSWNISRLTHSLTQIYYIFTYSVPLLQIQENPVFAFHFPVLWGLSCLEMVIHSVYQSSGEEEIQGRCGVRVCTVYVGACSFKLKPGLLTRLRGMFMRCRFSRLSD
jgi:hypothetical protein